MQRARILDIMSPQAQPQRRPSSCPAVVVPPACMETPDGKGIALQVWGPAISWNPCASASAPVQWSGACSCPMHSLGCPAPPNIRLALPLLGGASVGPEPVGDCDRDKCSLAGWRYRQSRLTKLCRGVQLHACDDGDHLCVMVGAARATCLPASL